MSLHGKTALVTGGARGIGFATVQRLLREGARCVIWDRDQAAIDEATANLADVGEVTSDTVELAKPESVEAAAGQALGRHGQIDILVNNAGIAGINKKLWECTPQEWRDVIEIDLFGVFLCCRAFVPGMIEAGWGRIVNIASVDGIVPFPGMAHYAASKAAVISLTKTFGAAYVGDGVLVNGVAPGAIDTEPMRIGNHIARLAETVIPM
ncbi:MAG: SDR family oxidoreductase, partial [Verrucomicrobia bacterium]|nr:SDR family oxidoreductase [Verrucomicrobiota bacterium]